MTYILQLRRDIISPNSPDSFYWQHMGVLHEFKTIFFSPGDSYFQSIIESWKQYIHESRNDEGAWETCLNDLLSGQFVIRAIEWADEAE